MISRVYTLTAVLWFGVTAVWAQQPPGVLAPLAELMNQNLFPPELVMQNQRTIELTEDQKDSIKADIQKAQAGFIDLQWQQHAESETMASLLKQEPLDEKQILSQLDKVLDVENDIKRTHFALIVRIKNSLTPEQQNQLREIKRSMRRGRRPGSRPRPDGARPPGPRPPQRSLVP